MAYARRHGAVGTAGAAGAGQGMLNAVNGLTDIAIDMANETLQRFTFSLLPPIPKIDWSKDKVTSRVGISENETAHLLSKVFGGQGLMLLLTVGLSSLAAGEAAAGKVPKSGTIPRPPSAAKNGPGARFIVDQKGNVVDTVSTPRGSYSQPNGGRTDILQSGDHGAGFSHTHDPILHTNPKTGKTFMNGLQKPGRSVSPEDIANIRSGAAAPAPPKGRQ